MAISDEISRLQTAKADLKTAIENKGVTVPSSAKLDSYSTYVDSIEQGGGGTVPYIVNPLNGGQLGTSASVGTVTHQYQVSSGTIVNCSIYSTMLSAYGDYSDAIHCWNYSGTQPSYPFKTLYNNPNDLVITITDNGLLTADFQRTQRQVNRYPWLASNPVGIIITLENGITLVDYFIPLGGYSCFIKGTKISLANGEKINVEDINYDTDLLVWNFDDGKYDSAKPLWIKKTETTAWYYKLKFSNGIELNVTGTYPEAHSLFSVEDGKFIHANKLVGKKVYTLDGIATLESCEEVHENVEFYNIITNYHMNLFANNVLTSTSLNNLYPIKDMKFVKEDREPIFDYAKFSEDWIIGARLKEQPTDVTEYCLNCIRLSKINSTTQKYTKEEIDTTLSNIQ